MGNKISPFIESDKVNPFVMCSTLHCHPNKMLHKHIETDILGEIVAVCSSLASLTHLVRVHLNLNLSLMSIIGMRNKESGHGETLLHNVLGIFDW